MRSFSSKYSAYNEQTLEIAEKLGIKYIFGRGTAGAKAVVYKPKEYNISILSTSDVPLKHMGGGTLADGSFWSRGATPEDFKEILFSLKEDRITLVAQAQLSGVKLNWWNVYQEFFEADLVDNLKEFATHDTLPERPLSAQADPVPLRRACQSVTPVRSQAPVPGTAIVPKKKRSSAMPSKLAPGPISVSVHGPAIE